MTRTDTTGWPGTKCPVVAFSPHPDDLAFSATGLGQMAGEVQVTVVTVFTRSIWAPIAPDLTTESAVSAVRELEDMEWCRRLGVRRIGLQLADAGLRGYNDVTERGPELDDEPVRAALRLALPSLLSRGVILLPLGVGGHIDHILVRDIVLEAVGPRPSGRPVIVFYEDLPYAKELGPKRVAELAHEWFPTAIPRLVSLFEISTKIHGLGAYRSQVRPEDIAAVSVYAMAVGGADGPAERWWVM